MGRKQRFATTASLRAASRAGLSEAQADEAIEVMRSYYEDGKPVYRSYFRHLSNFLADMGGELPRADSNASRSRSGADRSRLEQLHLG
jgi:hypothetical protein